MTLIRVRNLEDVACQEGVSLSNRFAHGDFELPVEEKQGFKI